MQKTFSAVPIPRRNPHQRSDSIRGMPKFQVSNDIEQMLKGDQLIRGSGSRMSTPININGNDSIPRVIGSFILRSTIGEGSMSTYKLATPAKEPTLKYACKVILRKKIEDQSSVQMRFQKEIKILNQAQHPYVISMVDFMRDKQFYFIIFDYCPRTLFETILKSPFPEPQAAKIFKQIVTGVKHVHENSVIHRDLKPENIWMTDEGVPKISNFVHSRHVAEDNLASTPCGSPSYASPETLSGKPYNGKISDIWSLGVTLYAMVVGSIPWTARQRNELFTQIRAGQYKVPHYVSESCKSLITAMLCVDVKKRISLDEILSHPFLKNIKLPKTKQTTMEITPEMIDHVFNSDDSKLATANAIRAGVPMERTGKPVIRKRGSLRLDRGIF